MYLIHGRPSIKHNDISGSNQLTIITVIIYWICSMWYLPSLFGNVSHNSQYHY